MKRFGVGCGSLREAVVMGSCRAVPGFAGAVFVRRRQGAHREWHQDETAPPSQSLNSCHGRARLLSGIGRRLATRQTMTPWAAESLPASCVNVFRAVRWPAAGIAVGLIPPGQGFRSVRGTCKVLTVLNYYLSLVTIWPGQKVHRKDYNPGWTGGDFWVHTVRTAPSRDCPRACHHMASASGTTATKAALSAMIP